MARAATSRLKCNPPLGRLPVLQYLPPAELQIDAEYQRSIEGQNSQALIRKIAQYWNWDLCQPLVVSRRAETLFVIDGQHRLAAARLRGDIGQLPCVVVEYASPADEAASFVHLNRQRAPLNKLDIFRAAVASEDPEAKAILAAIEVAGLKVAPHSNYTAWKPGMISNIGGVERIWRSNGAAICSAALRAMAEAMEGQVLRYAGTIFPGIAAVCAVEMSADADFGEDIWPLFIEMIHEGDQQQWRREVMIARAENPNLRFAEAAAKVFHQAWSELLAEFLGEAA